MPPIFNLLQSTKFMRKHKTKNHYMFESNTRLTESVRRWEIFEIEKTGKVTMLEHTQPGTLCQHMEFRWAKTDLTLVIMDHSVQCVPWARLQVTPLTHSGSCNPVILGTTGPAIYRGGNWDIEKWLAQGHLICRLKFQTPTYAPWHHLYRYT